MTHENFMLKLAELHMELSKVVIKNDFTGIEYWSKKIGILITRYLDENSVKIERD